MDVFSINIDDDGGLPVLRLEGELDIASAERLDEEIRRMEGRLDTLTLDLSGLTFMDSQGLRVLLGARQRADSEGWRLVVVPGPENVRRVFRVAGVEDRFDFAPDPHTERPRSPR